MPSANAIEQIYDQLMQVFGGTNANQFFTMLMPATTLDQASYAYDTRATKPALVAAAESLLVDQLFDVAKVTGSANGERVSSQYMQALSVLVPVFDPAMPVMKNALRDFINSPAPSDATVDGAPFSGNLAEYYFALYESWLSVKSLWDTDVQNAKNTLDAEKFLEWFEEHADGRLAQIDASMGRLLAVFSPADMNAILGALESGPNGELEVALATAQDIRLPSPSGGYFYPVDLTPDNWFLDLASDMDPADLLQDPKFIAMTIAARRQAIMASISQVQAMIAQSPTPAQMKAAADKLDAAQTSYTSAQNALLNTYAANTAVAVEMYLDAETGGKATDADKLAALNKNAVDVSKAKGDVPTDTGATKVGGVALTTADVEDLLKGQQDLINAQSSLLTSSQALADAGMNLSSAQAQTFGDLPVMLARLQSQLSDLQTLQSQVDASAAAAARRPKPTPLSSTAVMTAAKAVITAINAAPTTDDAATMKAAVTTAVAGDTGLASITTAATDAANVTGATGASVAAAAIAAATDLTGAPTAEKALTSERFMSLQFAFNSTDMQSNTSSDSQFSQTSWSVDLFFGSASGQSSSSSSNFSKSAFDASTSIEIGFKAAKVDVSRGWFNPGVFKLSQGMNRLSSARVSEGPVDFGNATDLKKANDAILPSFPVAFVVAKDVTIRFQASSSSLKAVQSIVDSRSAAGGGFLCFSASSSSASHSDQSSLSSKSDGTVITINMPGPQILGWFMEFTPLDRSTQLTQDNQGSAALSIIDFVGKLKRFSPQSNGGASGLAMVQRTQVQILANTTKVIDLGNSNGMSISAIGNDASVHVDYDAGRGVYSSAIKGSAGYGNPFLVSNGATKMVAKSDLESEVVRVGAQLAGITVSY
jgi:hypothetical protein